MQESVKKGTDTNFQSLTQPASRTRMTLALIIIAGFLDVIDFSIVQVALPTIRTELVVSLAESQWIIGAYGLTLAGFLMLSGRAGDVYGQKKIFIAGILVFTPCSDLPIRRWVGGLPHHGPVPCQTHTYRVHGPDVGRDRSAHTD